MHILNLASQTTNSSIVLPQESEISPENSSASPDLAGNLSVFVKSCHELFNVVGSGRRTRQWRRIWPENSSVSSDQAGELVIAGNSSQI
ncbi:hypothetical protein Bca101_056442 [Brassica carinata]